MIQQWLWNENWDEMSGIKVMIAEVKDAPFSDSVWCNRVNDLIRQHIALTETPETTDVLMLGGRDSFLKSYQGPYPGEEIKELPEISATKIRKYPPVPSTTEQAYWYRVGMVAAQSFKPYGNIYPTVDALIYNKDSILLGKKHGEKQYRMPGGHVDLRDFTFEEAVLREVKEECGENMVLGIPQFYMTARLNDRRYKGTKDKVFTTVFRIQYYDGLPVAGDDLGSLEWVNRRLIKEGKVDILDDHKQILLDYVTA